MRRHALLLSTVVLAAVASAGGCDEDPPQSAYESPTPFASPDPEPTPVPVIIPAGEIAVQSGRIASTGQADLYAFDLTSGDVVRVDVDAQGLVPSSANLDALLTLYAPTGELLAIADDGTNLWEPATTTPGALRDPYLVATATATGRYTLVVEDSNGAGANNAEYDYRVSFSKVTATATAGGNACADAVPLPALTGTGAIVSISGTLSSASTDTCCNTTVLPCVGARVDGDDVTYLATFTSGQRVQITRTGSAFDGALYVTTDCQGGSNASIIDSCRAGGDGSDDADGVVFTAPVTGSYYIFVDGRSGASGSYTLDLRQMP